MEQYTQSSQPVRGVVTSAAQTAYTAPYQSAAMDTGAPAVLGAMPPMEQYTQSSQPVRGVVTSAAQTAYTAPYQSAAMDTGAPAVLGAMPPGIQLSSTFPINPHQLAYQQIQQLREQQQQLLHEQRQLQEQQQRQEQQQQHLQEQQWLQEHQQFQAFWASRMGDIEQTTDFKSRCLPLSRIKKIMKADEGVKMISAEVPMVFAKACEMFIMELTLRSWNHTQENKRRTLQKNDIAAAIAQTDLFDFLVDIIPRVESKEESSRTAGAALPTIGAQANSMPYYYVPPQNQVTGAEMIMGRPGDQTSTGGM